MTILFTTESINVGDTVFLSSPYNRYLTGKVTNKTPTGRITVLVGTTEVKFSNRCHEIAPSSSFRTWAILTEDTYSKMIKNQQDETNRNLIKKEISNILNNGNLETIRLEMLKICEKIEKMI